MLRVAPVTTAEEPPVRPDDRPTQAARWAIEIDAQLRTTIRARRPVVVRVPAVSPRGESRAVAESIRAYRNLRLVVCPRKDFTLAARGRRLAKRPISAAILGGSAANATGVEL